ncbi:MAG TPA: hypothetical protein VFC84_20390 [Desulfosporosinus sp.]|nr:hypothetical protein [Desulfosporosinus sp.]
MNERAKLLRVSAIIASILTILCTMFIVTFCVKDGFTIYPYFGLLVAFVSCIRLWKMFLDEKNNHRKSV